VVISSLHNDAVDALIGRKFWQGIFRFRHILRLDSMAKLVRRMNPATRVYRRKEEVMDAGCLEVVIVLLIQKSCY
jgi:hypothetical protein